MQNRKDGKMKIKDTLKLFKYTYQHNTTWLVIILFVFQCILFIVADIGTAIMGMIESVTASFFINQTYMIMASGMIQSSEKFRKDVFKNFAIISLIFNVVLFFVFIFPKYLFIRLYVGEPDKTAAIFLINYMICNILSFASIAFMYKKQMLGMLMTVAMIYSTGMLMLFILKRKQVGFSFAKKIIEGNIKPANSDFHVFSLLLLAALAVTVISPFIFYLISKKMEKIPISQALIDRMPWGKL